MASAAADISFYSLSDVELRQWVEDHPDHVNDLDGQGATALARASLFKNDAVAVPLVQWLIDTKGADVNRRTEGGRTALHVARTMPPIRALLERNAGPTRLDDGGWSPLMQQARWGRPACVACLLEDRRVVETINATVTKERTAHGCTALHIARAAPKVQPTDRPTFLRLLLAAGADPCRQDGHGRTPLQLLKEQHPANEAALAALEEGIDAERAISLIQVRRLVVAQRGVELRVEAEGRRVHTRRAAAAAQAAEEEARPVAFAVGLGTRRGCPRDVFLLLMHMLLLEWSRLCRNLRV